MKASDEHPQLSHLGIFTNQQDLMQSFYEGVLGLLVTDVGIAKKFKRRIVFMSSTPEQHHQFVLVQREEGDPPLGQLFQLSFKVASLSGIRKARERAIAHGAKNFRPLNHGNSWSLYFEDPERNTVEIYMDTPWYVSQPFADHLDLDQSDEAIHALTEARIAEVEGACVATVWSEKMQQRLATGVANAI
jgi:catechol 2,3-dioxygenase